MACVPLQPLKNGLLRVVVSTSAGDLPALLDTGAPVSIINTAAARLLGVGTYECACALHLSLSRRRTPRRSHISWRLPPSSSVALAPCGRRARSRL